MNIFKITVMDKRNKFASTVQLIELLEFGRKSFFFKKNSDNSVRKRIRNEIVSSVHFSMSSVHRNQRYVCLLLTWLNDRRVYGM